MRGNLGWFTCLPLDILRERVCCLCGRRLKPKFGMGRRGSHGLMVIGEDERHLSPTTVSLLREKYGIWDGLLDSGILNIKLIKGD